MTEIERLRYELEQCKYIIANIVEKEPMTHKYVSSSVEHEMNRIVDGWRYRWNEEAEEETADDK